MQFIVTLVVSAFLIAGATSAEATSPTGNKLYDDCRSKNDFKEGFCLGFIEGVIETSRSFVRQMAQRLGSRRISLSAS